MVQALEKGPGQLRLVRDPEFDRSVWSSPWSTRSSNIGSWEPLWLAWEGQEAPAGGMLTAPAPRGQQALQVLAGRDQHPLDVGVQEPP